MKISQVIFYFLLATLIFALPPLALKYTGNTDWLCNGFWIAFFFMSGLTFLVLMLMLYIKQKNSEYFAQAFLAGTTIKIVVCIIFIFVFLHKNTPDKTVFLANFAYIYLLNMGFELYVLLRKLRHENLR